MEKRVGEWVGSARCLSSLLTHSGLLVLVCRWGRTSQDVFEERGDGAAAGCDAPTLRMQQYRTGACCCPGSEQPRSGSVQQQHNTSSAARSVPYSIAAAADGSGRALVEGLPAEHLMKPTCPLFARKLSPDPWAVLAWTALLDADMQLARPPLMHWSSDL